MPHPHIVLSPASPTDIEADAIIIAVPALTEATSLVGTADLADALAAIGFTGSPGAYTRVYAPGLTDRPLAVVGLGPDPDHRAVRDGVGTAVRSLTGFEHLAVAVLTDGDDHWRAAAEGAALGGYRFADYRTDDADKTSARRRASTVTVLTTAQPAAAELAAIQVDAEAVALVKDLVSTPAEWLGPADLADVARSSTEDLPIEVTVWDEAALKDAGFGGILGVGQGSDRPPRLVRLDYAPTGAERHVALVGKGITFDTGGLSLKPAASMIGMQEDMAGAAEVLAVVRAAAQREGPVRVTAWMCLADNMPSGRATRPGDVLVMADGTTVEVTNTDAEGRLVLADGLIAAGREQPDVIVDVATLTGAVIIALGSRHTGVMGHGGAVEAFLRSAENTDEDAWGLPLPEYLAETLESRVADLQNANMGNRAAGALFAGLFLQRFIPRQGEDKNAERIPWVHLDIAGSGMSTTKAFGFTDKGPTGASTRALIDFVVAGGELR